MIAMRLTVHNSREEVKQREKDPFDPIDAGAVLPADGLQVRL